LNVAQFGYIYVTSSKIFPLPFSSLQLQTPGVMYTDEDYNWLLESSNHPTAPVWVAAREKFNLAKVTSDCVERTTIFHRESIQGAPLSVVPFVDNEFRYSVRGTKAVDIFVEDIVGRVCHDAAPGSVFYPYRFSYLNRLAFRSGVVDPPVHPSAMRKDLFVSALHKPIKKIAAPSDGVGSPRVL
jgi:hypothetical protein